jgi:uncharacterized RDD family membrane protein YckC
VSSASVPPPGWIAPKAPIPLRTPTTPGGGGDGGDFAAEIAFEDRRRLDTRRVRARIIDNLICAPVFVAVSARWGTDVGYLVGLLALMVMTHVYEVRAGTSPGKRIMRLRVARKADGGLPTPFQAGARAGLGLIENGIIGLIALHFSKGRTRLGDRVAGTVVVDATVHPIAPRRLSPGAMIYPVVWSIPVLLACWALTHAGSSYASDYRARADAICLQGEVAVKQASTPRDLVAIDDQMVAQLDSLSVPESWGARHYDLVNRLRGEDAELRDMLARAQRSAHPATTWRRLVPSLQARLATDNAAITAAGYQRCGDA